MASALEARTKFPQLVTGEEKRVRFVVVHGLELVERPNLSPEDAEWLVFCIQLQIHCMRCRELYTFMVLILHSTAFVTIVVPCFTLSS